MVKIQKRTTCALGAIFVTVALIIMMAYPAYAPSAFADYQYALNQENWDVAEETVNTLDVTLARIHTVTIDAKGYAFQRVDEETIKQYNTTTHLVIQIRPATESANRSIDIMGSVKIKDSTYTITGGKVFLRKEKKRIFLKCNGTDESGNQITLKFGAEYFWWGGKAYALRSIALLQTADKPMLLLQRGIARIN